MMWHLILLGYVFGVAVGLCSDAPFFAGVCFIAAISVIAVWWHGKVAQGIALMLVLTGAGYMHAHTVRMSWNVVSIERNLSGQATIVRSPEIKERTQEAVLRFIECLDGGCPKELVLGYFPVYDALQYGDVISLECPLKVPKNDGLDFDYRMYLAMKGIGFTCYPKTWQKENEIGGNAILRSILHTRQKLEEKLDRTVAYPESGLGKGLLFGGSGYLTDDMQDAFARTGMSHIVAVSGANVVIVVESFFLLAILCGLWRKQALWAAGGSLVVFVLMVGASASAIRAGLMGGLVLLASYSGRVSGGLRLWSLVLALMLAWNPLLLRYDLGFQLSFMATLGILLCMPLFESVSLCRHVWIPQKLQEIFWMTIAAEAFVLPLILYNFHALPTVSILANLLVLPAIPFAMLFGLLASVFGFVFVPLAEFFGLIGYLVLHVMISIIRVLSGQSFASVDMSSFGIGSAFWWYVVLFASMVFLKVKISRRSEDNN